MGLHYDRTLYADFEYLCWDGPAPEGSYPDIIQIGIVEASTLKLEITRKARYYVRPDTGQVSEFCTNLTGITAAQLKKEGRYLNEVVASIVKTFGPRNKVVYTWGSDSIGFGEVSSLPGLEVFPHRVDLGVQFRIDHGLDKNISLLDALAYLGCPADVVLPSPALCPRISEPRPLELSQQVGVGAEPVKKREVVFDESPQAHRASGAFWGHGRHYRAYDLVSASVPCASPPASDRPGEQARANRAH